MKSIIICEGNTDSYLLQNLMKNAFGWNILNKSSFTQSRFNVDCEKNGNIATISVAGDSNKISETFGKVLAYNLIAADQERYQKIILVTDNDVPDTKEKQIESFVKTIQDIYKSDFSVCNFIEHDWNNVIATNKMNDAVQTDILLIMLPPDGNGALETFLLESASQKDTYDGKIVDRCNVFVEGIDEQKRYLKKARQITKAKFNVYMSIVTASVPYKQQENLLKAYPWKNNEVVLTTFSKLKEL